MFKYLITLIGLVRRWKNLKASYSRIKKARNGFSGAAAKDVPDAKKLSVL